MPNGQDDLIIPDSVKKRAETADETLYGLKIPESVRGRVAEAANKPKPPVEEKKPGLIKRGLAAVGSVLTNPSYAAAADGQRLADAKPDGQRLVSTKPDAKPDEPAAPTDWRGVDEVDAGGGTTPVFQSGQNPTAARGSVLDRPAVAAPPDRMPEEGMLTPEFVRGIRGEFGKIPPEKRFDALRELASGNGVKAMAARIILRDAEAENMRADFARQERPGMVDGLERAMAAPRVPIKAVPGNPPEATVNFPETGALAQWVQQRDAAGVASRHGAARAVADDQRSIDALTQRGQAAASDPDAKAFASENPMTSAVASGAANMLRGLDNIVPTVLDFASNLVGAKTSGAKNQSETSAWLERKAQNLMPEAGQQEMGAAWHKGEFGEWLMLNLAANAPQLAPTLVAAFVPGTQGAALGLLGGIAAGNKYADTGNSAAAVASGMVEGFSERLPLKYFERSAKALSTLPPAIRGKTVQAIGKALPIVGKHLTAQAIVGAIEEVVAQIGNNAIDATILEKDNTLLDGVAEAAVIGAFASGGLSLPQGAGAIRRAAQSPEQHIAQAIDQAASQYGLHPKAAATLRDKVAIMDPAAATAYAEKVFAAAERAGLVKKPGGGSAVRQNAKDLAAKAAKDAEAQQGDASGDSVPAGAAASSDTGLADDMDAGAILGTQAEAPQATSGEAPTEGATDGPMTDEPAQPGVEAGAAPPIEGEKINKAWSAFTPESGTLNIPREQMPQVDAEHRGALVQFLGARGITHESAEVPADSLKPTQAEFSPKKVEHFAGNPSGRSILVSQDGYVLDGHHQWMAKRAAGEPVKVIRLGAPIQDLLRLAHQFPSSTTSKGPTNAVSGNGSGPRPGAGGNAQPGSADTSGSGGTVDVVQGELPQPGATGTAGAVVPGADAGNRPAATGPGAGNEALTPAAPRSIMKPGFDSDAWQKNRDDRIKASREAGNTHLDTVPAYVETMRGKQIGYVHDPKVKGRILTVDNSGNVYVEWLDAYSQEKEGAVPMKYGNKTVMQTSLGPRDLKDYTLAAAPAAAGPTFTEGQRVQLAGQSYTVTTVNGSAVKLQGADGGTKMVATNSKTFGQIQPEAAPAPAEGPGSDAGNGFKQGPKAGERYRVGVVASVGGAVSLEKRLPAGTAATFYIGKDGNLIDGDSVNLIGDGKDRLWIPATPEQAQQAQAILDEMGRLELNDPARKDAKARLKALVQGKPTQEPNAQQAPAPRTEAPAPTAAPATPASAAGTGTPGVEADGLKPRKTLQEARTDAALDKQVRENGEVLTRRQWVERKVAEGLKTKVTQEDRIKPMSRMAYFRANNEEQRAHDRKVKEAGKKDVFWIGDYEVTKTEHDYANALTAEKAATPNAAAPASTQAPAAPAVVPGAGSPGVEADGVKPTGPVIQNRDRSTPAAITQMRGIAGNPDYLRLSSSRDFTAGAPVIVGSIPLAQMGRKETMAAGKRRIPGVYAVVEAAELVASNSVDGSANPAFEKAATKVIAGNGRTAGLQEAYRTGKAGNYRAELEADESHGINPDVIRGMKAPVLVRVMPASEITDDIGDISNTQAGLQLSAVEQARNDANRVNLDALEFTEDGRITPDTVRRFVQAMPQAEQGNLINRDGSPTTQAVDRLNAVVFFKAYNSEPLTNLYAQTADPDARNIMSALAQAATSMARLEGAGALDIRPLIAEAAEIAINGRRNGLKLSEIAAQDRLDADPDTRVILNLFASNANKVKPVAEALKRAADFAYSEANKPADDMFGSVSQAGRGDVVSQIGPRDEARGAQNLEEPAGGKPAGRNAEGQSPEGPGQGNAGAAEEGASAGQAEGLTPAERRKLEAEYQTRATEVLQEVDRRGDLKKLFRSFAGVRTIDGFTELAIDEQASAYADYIEAGAKPVSFSESYTEKVTRMERDALVRRLQSDNEVRQSSGKPFKTEGSAKAFQREHDLTITHEPRAVDGGFVLRLRPPAAQAESRRAEAGLPSYAEAQSAVAAEMGIGETPDGELDATDEQFAEMDRRIAARMRGEAPPLSLTAESEADAQAKAKREADALAAEQKAKADEQARLKREANKREADARAAEILAEREAAKKAEVDAAADDFALGQEPPKPVEKKVAAKDLAGQKDIFGGATPEEVVPAPQSLPDSVKTMLRWGLGRLNDARDALAGVERARGHGHTLAVEWKEQQQAIKEGRNKLAEIRGLADKNGMRATVEDYIREQGGEPDIERFNAAPAPAKRAPKSFRQSHKVTTSVFMEDTGTFSQQEVDADTALTALAADIEALNALRNCIAGV